MLRERNEKFFTIAKPFVDKLYEIIAGSKLIVFLSDAFGVIIESVGDYDISDHAAKVNLVNGSDWKEESVGTNGIGTALKLHVPIQISGEEHYCAKLHHWTCSAAPIFNDEGKTLGALQVSGPSSEVHLHTLGMVVAAAEAIRHQIRAVNKNRELSILNNSLNKVFHTMSDGAVIINTDGIISQVNPAGKQILGNKIKGRSIKQILERCPKVWKGFDKGEAYTDVEMMVETSRGRYQCLVTGKPIKDGEHNITGAVIFFNQIKNVKKIVNRFNGAQASFEFSDIIGSSQSLRKAMDTARHAAASAANILIYGESGTGKELFAQAIHNHSLRREGPFVALNCAALPRDLIASELFGYAEGAFTGGRRGGRPGKFEMADRGTLFLDEIGDMPLDQQAILLRVLQDKKISRLGGENIIPVDVRIVCATNRNLQEAVHKGHFRSDLYYRLNIIQVSIPPLRERMEDFQELFDHLLEKISGRWSRRVDTVSEQLLGRLMDYGWPGNVRELENVIEKMVNASHGAVRLGSEHLPLELTMAQTPGDACSPVYSSVSETIKTITGGKKKSLPGLLEEKEILIHYLTVHKGNISQVARELHLSRNTVYRRLQFYKISKKQMFK